MNLAKVYMWCYNPYSESGAELASALGILRIKHENSTFVGNSSHTVIYWGSPDSNPHGSGFRKINPRDKTRLVCNKTRFFKWCATHSEDAPRIPDWTEEDGVAKKWLREGHCVIGRRTVTGEGGEGIVIMEEPVDFEPCLLYTKYIPKEREFRVYVVKDAMVDFCSKKRKLTETPKNWKIRSRENGFVFCWDDPDNMPADCVVQSIRAIAVVGMDMGGVDVVYNEAEKRAYVLEVNSAPFLHERTAVLMAEAIKEKLLK